MPQKALDKMTVEELEAEKLAVAQQIEALVEHKRELARAIDAKLTQAVLERKLATLNDVERAALAQMIAPSGIESRAAVGTPGA